MHRFNGSFRRSLHYAPLTLTTLAALAPTEIKTAITIYDETVEDIPADIEADIIGITTITGTAPRAYRWAEYFRGKGIAVVIGGVHSTLAAEEVGRYADAVVTGPAEESWPRLLSDFASGEMKRIYNTNGALSLSGLPSPRRDLLQRRKYITINTVEATKGCGFDCGFCIAPVFTGNRIIKRPVNEVIAEIENLSGKTFSFIDVNLTADGDFAKRLFTDLIPLKKWWFGLVTANVIDDDSLFRLMVRSGCKGVLIGFESVSPSSLAALNKPFNRVNNYEIVVKKLHDNGIAINGTFVFGTDEDDKDVFERTVEFVQNMKIDLPRYSIVTPFPGTPLYNKLEREGRIFERDWAMYDVEHCVFRPAKMSPDELEEGLQWAWKETYKISSIAKRIADFRLTSLLDIPMNFAYRRYADELPRFTRDVMIDNSDVPVYE